MGVARTTVALALVTALGCDRRTLPAPAMSSRPEPVAVEVAELDAGEPDAGEPEVAVVMPPADAAPVRPGRPALDLRMDDGWPAVNAWNARMEEEYGAFVAALGSAIAERRCRRLDQCLRDPGINTLFDEGDRRLRLSVDCADLPYILRGYFAFKRRLPFGFVSRVRGHGDDARYTVSTRPDEWRHWRQYRTPRAFFASMTSEVHSGMYRLSPRHERGDFYPPAMRRGSVRPGSAFYDPNGHVLVVTEVRRDGAVYLIDGHPDGSLTFKRFGEAFAVGTRGLGGGFKNFRPLRWDGRALTRATNAEIEDFDGDSQYSPEAWAAGAPPEPVEDAGRRSRRRQGPSYYDWVRRSLAAPDAVLDPVQEFREQLTALCRDVADRAEAVQLSLDAGLHRRPHPPALPWNIYGTSGDWETYSTPSRDARLKASFRQLYEHAQTHATDPSRRDAMRAAWVELAPTDACSVTYATSAGGRVRLDLGEVTARLFAMSFDPYHCPELRWGAPAGSAELRACPDDAGKRGWYRAEQRLRNRIDRAYGVATPLEDGPEAAPELDPRTLLGVDR